MQGGRPPAAAGAGEDAGTGVLLLAEGTHDGAATLTNSRAVSQNGKHTVRSSDSAPGNRPKGKENSHKKLAHRCA